MGYEQAVKNYSLTVSAFWLAVVDRWQKARDNALKDPPKYTADNLASDVVALWAKGMDAWWGLLPLTGSPVLPSAVLIGQTAAGLLNKVTFVHHVTTIVSLPQQPQFTSTDLVGAADSIALARVKVTPKGDGFDINLDYTGVSQAPVAGLYQGLAYESTLRLPLAVILINLS